MRTTLFSIIALLFSTALIQMSNGLQATLLPIRANLDGFSTFSIGILGSAFHGGLMVGCLLCPLVVRRAGHIRSFTAFAAIAAISALLHLLFFQQWIWWMARALTGICFAGMQMVIESWLNERANNHTRGKILAVYTLTNLTLIVAGQQLMNTAPATGFALFALASIILSAAVIPIALTTSPSPAPIERVRLRIGWLYSVSPAAVIGAFGVGVANGSFWSLAPLFGQQANFSIAQITLFLAVTVLGGAAAQWPAGWISDLVDRRKVIVIACLGAAFAGTFIVYAQQLAFIYVLIAGVLFGVFSLPLYAICLAHASDHTASSDTLGVSGGLLLLYAIGATFGPLLAAFAMQIINNGALFYFTVTTHILLAAAIFMRTRISMPIAPQQKDPFVAIAETSPVVVELDPRAHEEE